MEKIPTLDISNQSEKTWIPFRFSEDSQIELTSKDVDSEQFTDNIQIRVSPFRGYNNLNGKDLKDAYLLNDSHYGPFTPCLKSPSIEHGIFVDSFEGSSGPPAITDHNSNPEKDLGIRLMSQKDLYLLGCPDTSGWLKQWCTYAFG